MLGCTMVFEFGCVCGFGTGFCTANVALSLWTMLVLLLFFCPTMFLVERSSDFWSKSSSIIPLNVFDNSKTFCSIFVRRLFISRSFWRSRRNSVMIESLSVTLSSSNSLSLSCSCRSRRSITKSLFSTLM